MSISKQRTESSNDAHSTSSDTPQIDKFRDLARELEADEDPSHFEETVRKIAPTTERKSAPKGEA